MYLGGTRVAAVTNVGKTLYYHTDHLGGANVLTDETGVVKEITEYEPYGDFSRRDTLGNPEEVAWHYFTGHVYDDETGLIYMQARYYDPKLGRFISADTIVQSPSNPQTFNRYSYAGNNPVNYIDPSGHNFFKKFWGQIASVLVGVAAFVGSGFNPVIGLQAYSLTNSLISGVQTIANGGNPALMFGSIAAGMLIGFSTADLIAGIGNLGMRIGAFALQGAAVGAAGAAINGGDIGMGAAFGAGFGAVSGFLSSQQMSNWRENGSFLDDKSFARVNQRVSDALGGPSSLLMDDYNEFSIMSGTDSISSINAGHTGMSLNGDNRGFYPGKEGGLTEWVLGKRVPGEVRVEKFDFVNGARASKSIYSAKINSYQSSVVQGRFDNPTMFSLATDCSHYALDTARMIGINVPSNLTTFGITNPSKVADWSKSIKAYSANY